MDPIKPPQCVLASFRGSTGCCQHYVVLYCSYDCPLLDDVGSLDQARLWKHWALPCTCVTSAIARTHRSTAIRATQQQNLYRMLKDDVDVREHISTSLPVPAVDLSVRPSWRSLPDDLTLRVFSHLDSFALARVAATSTDLANELLLDRAWHAHAVEAFPVRSYDYSTYSGFGGYGRLAPRWLVT